MVNQSLLLKALRTQEAIDLAREVNELTWGNHERSDETITPRSLSCSTGYRMLSDVLYDISQMEKGNS